MQDFLQSRLPQETLARIDLSSLTLTNKSFGTQEGKQRHSDLIYAAQIDAQSGYLYINVEHQSKQEAYMPLRQLEYNVLLMRQHLESGHAHLPLIINLCLYNGKRPYKGAIKLIDLFEHPESARQYLFEAYYLIDLHQQSTEEIKQDKSAALAQLILKQAAFKDFCSWIEENEHLLTELQSPYNEVLYLYMLTLDPQEQLIQKIERLRDPVQRELAMTAAQHLEQRGIQKGMQKGMQQGMQARNEQIALKLLERGMDASTVAEITGLSANTLKLLQEENESR